MKNFVISSVSTLVSTLNAAKCGGQYVAIVGESDVKLNKFPTDGSERIRIADGFCPRKTFTVTYHFGEDYERKMAKVLGVDTYNASDSNRVHLVKNVLMQYISTGTICMIYMPENYSKGETLLNGQPLTDEQKVYMSHYIPKHKDCAVVYRTLSLKNVKEIHIGGNVYTIELKTAEVA